MSKNKHLIFVLAGMLSVSGCWDVVRDGEDLDSRDLRIQVAVTGDPDLKQAAEAAIQTMGGRVGSHDEQVIPLAIRVDKTCPCGTEHSCSDPSNRHTLVVCPAIYDMSRNQQRVAVWNGVAQILWQAVPLTCEDGSVLSPSRCRNADFLRTWSQADLVEICSRARGGRCAGRDSDQ